MSDDVFSEHKLVEAIPQDQRDAKPPVLNDMPDRTHADVAEQQREAQESQEAHNKAQGHKERLIEIGKAGHMGGHTGGRVSDS